MRDGKPLNWPSDFPNKHDRVRALLTLVGPHRVVRFEC